jgi:adenylate cyclase
MAEEGFKRKLAAILSADVEGYSRLMDDDEEKTVRTLTAFRNAIADLVQQFRGRVVDTPGDNVLAEFTSVVDSVNCAVEIQRELAERNVELPYNRIMKFRIGVNLGDVIDEEGRIYGDGVNIAARMESMAEAGGICISGRAYDQVANKLGLEYENLGEHQVKNISTPIRVYKVLSFPGAAAHRVVQAKDALGRRWRRIALSIAAVAVVAVVILGIWQFYTRRPSMEPASMEKMAFSLPDKPSIAVLPFDNLSGDEKFDVFVDGMTEDIISALARFNQLFVIARNSTFTYKGKPVKIQQVAEELGVRYVLEGSVQISGNRLRVTAQLIDAITGRHMWVERYDRVLKDIFDVQDDLTKKLAGSLMGKLERATEATALLKHPNSLDAYSLVLYGRDLVWKFTPDDNAKGRELFQKALTLDPNYASVYAWLSLSYFFEWQWYGAAKPKETYKRAVDYAHKAVALDPREAWARVALGMVLLYDNKHDQAIAQFEEGLKANPNNADLLAGSADPYLFNGQPDEAVNKAKEGMRLNPYYPGWYLFQLGCAQYIARDYEGAVETLTKMSPLGEPRRILAASLAYLGRMDEAQAEAKRFLQDNPSFSTSHWSSTQPFRYDKDRQQAVQGYIMAGLPE